jgi:ATP-dependent DNA helicase RecG
MRETYNLGCKEKLSNIFLKTISAISNYNGRKIIFGVIDRGECIGVNATSLCPIADVVACPRIAGYACP